MGPSIRDLGHGTQDPYLEPLTSDLGSINRTRDSEPLPGNLYVGPIREILYVGPFSWKKYVGLT